MHLNVDFISESMVGFQAASAVLYFKHCLSAFTVCCLSLGGKKKRFSY